MENDKPYREADDPDFIAEYEAGEKEEREQRQAFTPGDRWSDPEYADPDALLINWL